MTSTEPSTASPTPTPEAASKEEKRRSGRELPTLTTEGYLLSNEVELPGALKCSQFGLRSMYCVGPTGIMRGIYRTGVRESCAREHRHFVACLNSRHKSGTERREIIQASIDEIDEINHDSRGPNFKEIWKLRPQPVKSTPPSSSPPEH
eukprot:TRINITY_DN5580_c0_g1_i1.p1 TRINITY_DN5580_c0_g1~~TRINITY_DN5580_c0_g1_i1.p1  ORF type:complete len:175 (-),score=26.39 TRINITY_DN5580_c0_g1_i1:53-499(-)